jgi:hypothetical protein
MSEPDRSGSSQSNTTMRTASPLLFGKKSASSHGIPMPSLPMRIAVVGNHLPRQCGIATFTTDLCDAIADEYGAAGVLVVAVNDPQSGYSYPARVRFEITQHKERSYYSRSACCLRTRDLKP